jgi:hypothetical protein
MQYLLKFRLNSFRNSLVIPVLPKLIKISLSKNRIKYEKNHIISDSMNDLINKLESIDSNYRNY